MTPRPASLDDVDDMLTIEARAGSEPWTAERLLTILDHAYSEAWVLEADDGVVAHLVAQVIADEAEILTVAVHPDWQEEGLATRLLRHVLEVWRARGVDRTVLEVRVDNTPALALYARTGFERVGLRSGYYADGTDAWILATERS